MELKQDNRFGKRKNKSQEYGISNCFWMNIVVPYLLKRAEHKSEICGSEKNLDVHHWRYDRQTIRDMNILCRSCHIIQHRGGRNKK